MGRRLDPFHRSIRTDPRGISPVIGSIALVAIGVMLAAVLGTMVLGVGDEPAEPAPYAGFEAEYSPTGEGNTDNRPYVALTHTAGEQADGSRIVIVDSDGTRIAWADVWNGGPVIEAGESAHIDGYGSDGVLNRACEGEVYRVIWDPPDDEPQPIATREIETGAKGPAATHC